MPDDNRFANIGVDGADADANADPDDADAAADSSDAGTPESSGTSGGSANAGTSASSGGSETTGDGDAESPTVDPADTGPAFAFDDVQQKAVYPRPDAWDARTEALDFEVKRKLREHGVKDVTGRELDDAVARTVPDVTDRIVEHVLEARRRKFDAE